jgi:hypothetical protein
MQRGPRACCQTGLKVAWLCDLLDALSAGLKGSGVAIFGRLALNLGCKICRLTDGLTGPRFLNSPH